MVGQNILMPGSGYATANKIEDADQQRAIEQFQNHVNQKLRSGPHPNDHVFVPDCLMLQVEFLAKFISRLINM